ncbi:Myotubularin- protein 2 [Balamuthia mandrillaris]
MEDRQKAARKGSSSSASHSEEEREGAKDGGSRSSSSSFGAALTIRELSDPVTRCKSYLLPGEQIQGYFQDVRWTSTRAKPPSQQQQEQRGGAAAPRSSRRSSKRASMSLAFYTLFLTNFQLVVIADQPSTVPQQAFIPLATIQRIKKKKDKEDALSSLCIELICKDIRHERFHFHTHPTKSGGGHTQFQSFYENLLAAVFPSRSSSLFCFHYTPSYTSKFNGWTIYNAKEEYKRLGLTSSRFWRLTSVNKQYMIAPTYPSVLVVPASIPDETLVAVAKKRSHGRIPTCVWKHPSSSSCLLRSSQPLVGLTRNKSKDDEELLEAIRLTHPSVGERAKLYIVDARPKKNARANAVVGGGFENLSKSKYSKLFFLGIDNIHVVREAHENVRKLSLLFAREPTDSQRWLWEAAQNSEWVSIIGKILKAASFVTNLLEREPCSVLTHCSDGWDRTSQITSLAMLMLDPYFRTLKGFAVLIEKEWLSFGHKFATRHGHAGEEQGGLMQDYKDKQRAPIFLQFLDCVWQLMQQSPLSFEFNERLLINLQDWVYSCVFGTFLHNCERQRMISPLEHPERHLALPASSSKPSTGAASRSTSRPSSRAGSRASSRASSAASSPAPSPMPSSRTPKGGNGGGSDVERGDSGGEETKGAPKPNRKSSREPKKEKEPASSSNKKQPKGFLPNHSVSVWSYVNTNAHLFLNELYEPQKKDEVLRAQVGGRNIRFWSGYFLRWVVSAPIATTSPSTPTDLPSSASLSSSDNKDKEKEKEGEERVTTTKTGVPTEEQPSLLNEEKTDCNYFSYTGMSSSSFILPSWNRSRLSISYSGGGSLRGYGRRSDPRSHSASSPTSGLASSSRGGEGGTRGEVDKSINIGRNRGFSDNPSRKILSSSSSVSIATTRSGKERGSAILTFPSPTSASMSALPLPPPISTSSPLLSRGYGGNSSGSSSSPSSPSFMLRRSQQQQQRQRNLAAVATLREHAMPPVQEGGEQQQDHFTSSSGLGGV